MRKMNKTQRKARIINNLFEIQRTAKEVNALLGKIKFLKKENKKLLESLNNK